MSENKEVVKQVSKKVDSLLKAGLRISVANKDTFYLYSTNKELIGSLMLYKDGKNKPEYKILLDGVSGVKIFNRSNDICKHLYNYVNRKYNFDISFFINVFS